MQLNNLRDAIQTERTKLIESKDGQIESLKLQLEECQSEMKIIRLHKETTVLVRRGIVFFIIVIVISFTIHRPSRNIAPSVPCSIFEAGARSGLYADHTHFP